MITPKYYTIVSGKGESKYRLVAFDNALLNAGIGDYNLVRVSSIIPSGCIFQNTIDVMKGSIIYAAYAEMIIKEGQSGSTAVAVALPENPMQNGVIFEEATADSNAKDIAINMCEEAMHSRNRSLLEIKCSSQIIKGIPGKYICGVSAVIMW